jgi:hypothetical protein
MLDSRISEMVNSIESAVARGLEYRQKNESEIQRRKLELEKYRGKIASVDLALKALLDKVGVKRGINAPAK